MRALRTKVINTALLLQLLPGCCDGGCQVLVELLGFFLADYYSMAMQTLSLTLGGLKGDGNRRTQELAFSSYRPYVAIHHAVGILERCSSAGNTCR